MKKLVLITWLDSSRGRNTWRRDKVDLEICKCKSVGWVIAESKKMIVITSNITDDQRCGEMAIPKCCIVSISNLLKGKRYVGKS